MSTPNAITARFIGGGSGGSAQEAARPAPAVRNVTVAQTAARRSHQGRNRSDAETCPDSRRRRGGATSGISHAVVRNGAVRPCVPRTSTHRDSPVR
ncbi:hypothetical protein [Streptomyces sp. NBC_01320]|uniref:hypothetical protein n=1 Tax=Streptomyces sp. NBC_01320 TaxID=2903824 RepID=UPI002E0E615F|nr:hypothetical protein OG395_23960 [Streptomyces sp. NBC_01320]